MIPTKFVLPEMIGCQSWLKIHHLWLGVGWGAEEGVRSVMECLPNAHEAVGSISSSEINK